MGGNQLPRVRRGLKGKKEKQVVKIQLKLSNLIPMPSFSQNEVELDAEPATLKALLQKLPQLSGGGIELIDPESEELDGDYALLVNGHELYTLPQGLETKLKNGDRVEIAFLMLAGG